MAQSPIVITGASSGMGKAAALALARQGIPLVLIVREGQRGRDAHAELVHMAANPDIELEVADLSSQAQIREAADRIRARHPMVAALVNVAGACFDRPMRTREGVEMTRAVNHVAPFLLSYLLLPPLAAYAGFHAPVADEGTPLPPRLESARIVNVVSAVQAELMEGAEYDGARIHAECQLANVQMTFELARRLEGSGITANCLAPSRAAPQFARASRGLADRGLVRFARRVLERPGRLGERIARLAADPELAEVNGAYFVRDGQATAHPKALDAEAVAALWDEDEALVGLRNVPA